MSSPFKGAFTSRQVSELNKCGFCVETLLVKFDIKTLVRLNTETATSLMKEKFPDYFIFGVWINLNHGIYMQGVRL